MHPNHNYTHSPTIIAHRGFSAKYPENSLCAIQKALEFGVDFVEIDVHLSKDGVPVVIHDATLGRTALDLKNRSIADLTWKELQSLSIGRWLHPHFHEEYLPSLEQVLCLNWQSTGLMIEVKGGYPPVKMAQAIISLLATIPHPNPQRLVGSFDRVFLDTLHTLAPFLPVIGIADLVPEIAKWEAWGASHLALHHPLFTPRLIRHLKSKGITLWTFTVDDPLLARTLHDAGIEGIITNHPERIKAKG